MSDSSAHRASVSPSARAARTRLRRRQLRTRAGIRASATTTRTPSRIHQPGVIDDEVVAYVAPMLLGAGAHAVADLGIGTIADARHLDVTDVTVLGSGRDTNVRVTMTPRKET